MMSYPFLSQSSEELSIICETTQLTEATGPPGPAPLKVHAHFQVDPIFSQRTLDAWPLNCAESASSKCGRDSREPTAEIKGEGAPWSSKIRGAW